MRANKAPEPTTMAHLERWAKESMSSESSNPKRETANTETKHDLAKSPEHLLTDIHDESLDRQRPLKQNELSAKQGARANDHA
jgi:hypothetical protein